MESDHGAFERLVLVKNSPLDRVEPAAASGGNKEPDGE
jgi:hypothetical protein